MEPPDQPRARVLRHPPGWEVLVSEKLARAEVIRRIRRRRLRLRLSVIAVGTALVISGFPFLYWWSGCRVTYPCTPAFADLTLLIGGGLALAGSGLLGAAGFNRFGKPVEALETDIE